MNSPKWNRLAGKGTFMVDEKQADSRFEILENPHWIGILPEDDVLADLIKPETLVRTPWRLRGTLDDGRPVRADKLLQTGVFSFTPFEGVSFGQDSSAPPTESNYPLTCHFGKAFSVSHDGWTIDTVEPDNEGLEEAQELSETWRCPVEGMTLRLRKPGASRSEHEEKARVVMLLLSLASGTGVSSQRHFFRWEDQELEVWRHMTDDGPGPGPIVPDFRLGHFVGQALPAWYALPKERRQSIRLAVTYVNLSAQGYLDTKLFHLMQAWELLASVWKKKTDLPKPIEDLRSRLLGALEQWKSEGQSDPQGFWGSRVSLLFVWTKLKAAIEELAGSFGVDLKIHGMDLDALKKARDGVAHSGRLPGELLQGDRQAVELLLTGQYCLQLLLLRVLKYPGLVNGVKDGWASPLPIDQAIRTKRTGVIEEDRSSV